MPLTSPSVEALLQAARQGTALPPERREKIIAGVMAQIVLPGGGDPGTGGGAPGSPSVGSSAPSSVPRGLGGLETGPLARAPRLPWSIGMWTHALALGVGGVLGAVVALGALRTPVALEAEKLHAPIVVWVASDEPSPPSPPLPVSGDRPSDGEASAVVTGGGRAKVPSTVGATPGASAPVAPSMPVPAPPAAVVTPVPLPSSTGADELREARLVETVRRALHEGRCQSAAASLTALDGDYPIGRNTEFRDERVALAALLRACIERHGP